MPIIVINGPSKAANRLMGDSLRNTAISSGGGALLIDDHMDGEARHHLEKIIAGDKFIEGTEAGKVNWKSRAAVVLIGKAEKRIDEFEAICPGFTKQLGPVSRMNLT